MRMGRGNSRGAYRGNGFCHAAKAVASCGRVPFAAPAVRILLRLCLIMAIAALPAPATENAYDTLAHVLLPIAGIFAEKTKGENRALSISVRVEASKGFPVDFAGQQADLEVEYPDKLRLHAPVLGESFTIVRRGQTVLVSPGARLKALLDNPDIAKKLPVPNRKFQLKPFGLPIPEKDLVFLPGLFQARLGSPEPVDGTPCQVLELRATPLIGRAFDVNQWSARAWADHQAHLMRLEINGPETTLLLRVEKSALAPALPPTTWTFPPGEDGDVFVVPPARYDQLLRAAVGAK